jgi:fatty-acyl-CoA synthase
MLELISAHRCTLAWTPNLALQFLAWRVNPADRVGLDLSSVRALINCSEPVRLSIIEEFVGAYSAYGLAPTAVQSCYAMAETVFAVTQSHVTVGGRRCIWVDRNAFRKEKLARAVPRDVPGAVSFVSSGRCLPGTQVWTVSNAGDNLDPGKVGEIVICCESILSGYYNR